MEVALHALFNFIDPLTRQIPSAYDPQMPSPKFWKAYGGSEQIAEDLDRLITNVIAAIGAFHNMEMLERARKILNRIRRHVGALSSYRIPQSPAKENWVTAADELGRGFIGTVAMYERDIFCPLLAELRAIDECRMDLKRLTANQRAIDDTETAAALPGSEPTLSAQRSDFPPEKIYTFKDLCADIDNAESSDRSAEEWTDLLKRVIQGGKNPSLARSSIAIAEDAALRIRDRVRANPGVLAIERQIQGLSTANLHQLVRDCAKHWRINWPDFAKLAVSEIAARIDQPNKGAAAASDSEAASTPPSHGMNSATCNVGGVRDELVQLPLTVENGVDVGIDESRTQLELKTPLSPRDLAKISGLPMDEKSVERLRKRLERFRGKNKDCATQHPENAGQWLYYENRVRGVIEALRSSTNRPPKK